MDMKDNQNNLVPGQGKPLNMDQLKRLAAGQPAQTAAPARAPRRFKRAGKTWAGALALGAMLTSAGALALHKDGMLNLLAAAPDRPAMPDEGMSPEEQAKYWALASYEPSRFESLMGVRRDEEARMEENARKLQRLLSDPETGLH